VPSPPRGGLPLPLLGGVGRTTTQGRAGSPRGRAPTCPDSPVRSKGDVHVSSTPRPDCRHLLPSGRGLPPVRPVCGPRQRTSHRRRRGHRANIRADASLVRLGFVANLLMVTSFILLGLALYALFQTGAEVGGGAASFSDCGCCRWVTSPALH